MTEKNKAVRASSDLYSDATLNPSSWLFFLLWLAFSLYAFSFAPNAASSSETLDLIIRLSSGQWQGINPLIVTLFNLMGVWPMIYACLALIDGVGQKVPAWPFVSAAFGVGAFALLPYLTLRQRNRTFTAAKSRLIKVLDSPWTGRVLLLATLGLLSYGLSQGSLWANWRDFTAQWQASRFIHVMSLDFCLLCALVAPLLQDDMAKRQMNGQTGNGALFWVGALVPLLGILLYLSVRSPLPTDLESADQ
jgi:hypothetical protein